MQRVASPQHLATAEDVGLLVHEIAVRYGVEIPLEIAYKCISYYGWFKHTDSKYVKDKYNIDAVCAAAKRRISKHAKSEIYGTSARSALAACQ